MIKKKGFISFLSICLSIIICNMNVFAASLNLPNQEVCVFSQEEESIILQDENNLDSQILSEESIDSIVRNNDYEIVNGVVEFSTKTQINTANTRAVTDDLFRSTTIYMIPQNGDMDTLLAEIQATREVTGTGAPEKKGWDKTVTVVGSIVVYYKEYVFSGHDYVGMYKITGKYTRADTRVSVQSQSLYAAQKGRTYEDGNQNKTVQKDYTSSSWTYTIPSTWKPVMTEPTATFVGANYTLVFKHQSGDLETKTIYNPIVTNGTV